MKELNEKLYEAKLDILYTNNLTIRYAYSARTLPEKWQQSTTITDLQLSMVMLYKSKDMKTKNTNFALLVSKNFTDLLSHQSNMVSI